MNNWQLLGIPENSTLDVIKSAYRKKAIQYHPDANSDPNAINQFKQINDAYQALLNPTFKTYHKPKPPVKRDIWGQPEKPTWNDSMNGRYAGDYKPPKTNHWQQPEKYPEIDLWTQMPKDPMISYWKEYNRLKIETAYEEPEVFWNKLDDWLKTNKT